MRLKAAIFLTFTLLAMPARAQLYTEGNDPASVRWMSISTPSYKVIYPKGLDSLATVYARKLEAFAPAVAGTIGMTTNMNYRKPLPVVLHSYNSLSNGMVIWTPRRMEFMTMPSAYSPESVPWVDHLLVHESRHAAQMQFGAGKPYRWLNVLTGQIAPGAISAVYGGTTFFEGDAVVTETALTPGGRGRTADFLEYIRVSFGAGDMRNFYRWRYGSLNRYAPDHYRAGYIIVGGTRAYYDTPDISARFYDRIRQHHGIAFNNAAKTLKEVNGMNFRQTFKDISNRLRDEWAADDSLRAPFMPSRQITATPRYYQDFSSMEVLADKIVAVRSGITRASEIVEIDSTGKVTSALPFAVTHSAIRYNPVNGRIYWSEYSKNPRWEQASESDIRTSYGADRKSTLTRKGNYYNPSPMPDGNLSATSYGHDGRSAVVIIDSNDGSETARYQAPDGMQVVETVWTGGKLYASAITDSGFGIYEVDGWKMVLDARNTKVKELWSHDGKVMFTCDLCGVNELYSLDPFSGVTMQLTNTRSGAASFRFNADASVLYYTVLSPEGRMICSTDAADLPVKQADFSIRHIYPIADKLTAGEPTTLAACEAQEIEVGESRRYVKAAHLFRFHSWAPVYVNPDVVKNMSFEDIATNVGLGATALFHNDLSTASGLVGYHAAFNGGSWRHSGHAMFTYSGLYPVIELSADFNDTSRSIYEVEKNEKGYSLKHDSTGTPSLVGSVSTYVPLSWSKGGWIFGFIPRARLSITNDTFREKTLSRLLASAQGYAMQRTPKSRIYPKLGIGAQVGYGSRPFTSGLICSNIFTNIYGYLPGFWETHGVRLQALFVNRLDDGMFCESVVSTAPRGFAPGASQLMSSYKTQSKISLDYALPFGAVDWSFLGPVAYIRNFELTLHGDLSDFAVNGRSGSIFSAGADLCVKLGNLLWLPYDTRIGVSYNYNDGKSFNDFLSKGYVTGHHSVSLVFNIDM